MINNPKDDHVDALLDELANVGEDIEMAKLGPGAKSRNNQKVGPTLMNRSNDTDLGTQTPAPNFTPTGNAIEQS